MSFGGSDDQKTADGRLVVDDQYVSHSASRLLIEKGGDHQAAGALRASGREMHAGAVAVGAGSAPRCTTVGFYHSA
jgi:hypothetical protein